MKLNWKFAVAISVLVLAGVVLTARISAGRTLGGRWRQPPTDRARLLASQPLSPMDGAHLKVSLVEVRYGPGEASAPHSHPCAVLGYVVEGELRTQVQGEAQHVYAAGETFYEPPNGVHLVSANAGTQKPAKLAAFFVCDREAPLSVDVPAAPGSPQ